MANDPTLHSPQGQQPQAPPMVVPLPYQPTEEEHAYLEVCGQAIAKGCENAISAEAAQNADAYLKFANGVKALTDAYGAIKNGGQPSRHQGS